MGSPLWSMHCGYTFGGEGSRLINVPVGDYYNLHFTTESSYWCLYFLTRSGVLFTFFTCRVANQTAADVDFMKKYSFTGADTNWSASYTYTYVPASATQAAHVDYKLSFNRKDHRAFVFAGNGAIIYNVYCSGW